MPPLRSSSLKWTREGKEEEDEPAEKRNGRSRAEGSMDKAWSLSVSASLKESTYTIVLTKARSFRHPLLPKFNVDPPSLIHLFPRPHPTKENKKEYFSASYDIGKVNIRELEKDLFTHKKSILGPIFKITSVDRNFHKPPVSSLV